MLKKYRDENYMYVICIYMYNFNYNISQDYRVIEIFRINGNTVY